MQKWIYALPLLALAWGHQAKAADIEAGKAKAAVCAACHGVDGKATVPSGRPERCLSAETDESLQGGQPHRAADGPLHGDAERGGHGESGGLLRQLEVAWRRPIPDAVDYAALIDPTGGNTQ